MKERAGNRSVKRQSLSELLSTLPIDWKRVTHPRLIFLRSQCFMSELPPCRGAMNNKVLGLWSRRGLLAYVYTGVSVLLKCLSGGKVALIYYGSVALIFTVRHFLQEDPDEKSLLGNELSHGSYDRRQGC